MKDRRKISQKKGTRGKIKRRKDRKEDKTKENDRYGTDHKWGNREGEQSRGR